jgi:uncharacterized membrane protein YhaH (DUF805 family)
MRRFPTGRLFATFVLAALLEPVGHAAAYALRYGPSMAWKVQSQGSHAYYPRIFSLSALSLLVALALALIAVVAIRLILGTRRVSSTGLRGTFLILAIVQCSLFVTKEALEALSVRMTPDLAAMVILAIFVQLPLAALAAWVVSWLRAYLALGAEAMRVNFAVHVRAPARPLAIRALPSPVWPVDLRDQRWYRRRGPPPSI